MSDTATTGTPPQTLVLATLPTRNAQPPECWIPPSHGDCSAPGWATIALREDPGGGVVATVPDKRWLGLNYPNPVVQRVTDNLLARFAASGPFDAYDGYSPDVEEPAPAGCADGLDGDGDGLADLDDPGCTSADDLDERSPLLACDDGADNDGDGRADFRAAGGGDPACQGPISTPENPQCQDGLDNDGQTGIDFDGGDSLDVDPRDGFIDATPSVAVGAADPQCSGTPWKKKERAGGCGLGFELVWLAAPFARLARARRHHPRSC